MLAMHITKAIESSTQCEHCDKVSYGEHIQLPPTKISHTRLDVFIQFRVMT